MRSELSDSLAFYFKIANDDSLPYMKRYDFNMKAYIIVSKEKNDSIGRSNLFKVANRFYNMGAFENYKKITRDLIEKAKEKNDSTSLIKAYNYLQEYYAYNFISDSAYFYNNKILNIYSKRNDILNIIKNILNKAIIQHNEGDFLGCEASVFKILKQVNVNGNEEILYQAYNLLGIVYGKLSEYDLSEKYYNYALEILVKNKFSPKSQFRAATLNNLGLLYGIQNNNKRAVQIFLLALRQKNIRMDRPHIYAALIDNLAYAKFKIGDYNNLPLTFYRALKIRNRLNIIPGIIINKIHLSEYYAFKKDTIKAIKFAKDAYDLGIKNNGKRDILYALQQLSKIDKKNAAIYSAEYYKINDNLQIAERKIRNKFARIEFEAEELIIEKEKLTVEKTNMLYISEIMFLLIIITFIANSYINKNKELEFSKKQQRSNEEIYNLILDQQQKIEEGKQIEKKRIAQELHDGIMGRLTGIRLNLFVLNKKTDKETIERCIKHVNEIQEIEKEIRSIAYDLHKKIFFDNANFIVVVKNLFTAIENHTDISFKLNVDDTIDWEIIDNNIKMQIYRILQEALQNIDKYSNAQNVIITMIQLQGFISIEIADDGLGFEKRKIKKGFGLNNMKSRANEIKAKIEINSQLGNGTKINLIIPIDFHNSQMTN